MSSRQNLKRGLRQALLCLLLQALLVVPLFGHWHAIQHGLFPVGSQPHADYNVDRSSSSADFSADHLFALDHNCVDYDAHTSASPIHHVLPAWHVSEWSVHLCAVPVQHGWPVQLVRSYSARAPPKIS